MKECVESKLDLSSHDKDDPPTMLLDVSGSIRSEEHQQEEGNMHGSKEARGKRRKVFCRPGAKGWHFFGGVNDKIDASYESRPKRGLMHEKCTFILFSAA